MDELYKILSLMGRMGENVTSHTLFDVMVEKRPLLIKEGLITTYPTESVIDSIAEHNGLSINGKWKDTIDSMRGKENEPNGDIRISKPNGTDEIIVVTLPRESELFDKINAHMLKYGWFNYRTDGNDDNVEYMFEKKFGDRFTVGQLLNMTDKIYHVTSSRLKKKILGQGLVPKKSKTPGFDNEPRIYFRADIPSKEQAYDLNLMKGDNAPPVVVEVDLNKLNKKQSFFFDARWKNSIFTFEPIPSSAIRVMDDSELERIKLNY